MIIRNMLSNNSGRFIRLLKLRNKLADFSFIGRAVLIVFMARNRSSAIVPAEIYSVAPAMLIEPPLGFNGIEGLAKRVIWSSTKAFIGYMIKARTAAFLVS